MTYRRARILTAILTTFLISTSHCFATTYYVNISSPPGGNGSSWAQAYNNLQSALAAASFFDQIWIAQGTYKPSSPAGRSATFSIPNLVNIYGGFNGSETAVTQANPTLYPTILSGDIGVVGNASDNCYHVLTSAVSYSECHGVTIRDGNANAGSSSLAQPDNTGGGVLFVSLTSNDVADTYFYNCTFTNNYAFYGAAMGSYATSADEINYNATNCFFLNNQAVYGGAIFNTIVATDYLDAFQNDVFYNNTASSGAASVFGNAVTNGTTTEYLDMQNCLFYNEAAPIFTNDFSNSAFSFQNIVYNIVWTSGTPYTAGYSAGNTPLTVSYSDVNASVPLGTNMDADPLFVNAAAGNFHVFPCSPIIDQGESSPPTTTDIGGNPRLQGPLVDLGPYETLKGTVAVLPTVNTPVNACLNGTGPDLTTEVTSGSNLLWYAAATGGTGSSTAPTPSTTALGTTAYYVTQTPSGSCESPRQEIDVTVNSLPADPTYTAVSPYCIGASANPLSAFGASLLWYTTATGGTGSSTPLVPSTTASGTTPYYVTQTVNGCESQRAVIDVTVSPPSTEPSPNTVPQYCLNSSANPLSAIGDNLRWYTTATGGTGSTTAPTPGTATAAVTPYYVTQTPNGSCESDRLEMDVTVNSLPSAPTFTPPPSYCINDIAAHLSATGSGLQWYATATGGSPDATAPTPNTAVAATTPYYVTQTVNGCESPRTLEAVTVNATPSAPTYTPIPPYCVNTTADPLSATGAGLQWYTTATGGAPSSTAPTPSTATPATNTWWVTQTVDGCVSPRQAISVTVSSPSAEPTADPVAPYCQNTMADQLTANGTGLLWYPTATGGSSSTSAPIPSTSSVGIKPYFVTQTTSGFCESSRLEIDVTVNPAPAAPGVGVVAPYCPNTTADQLTATGSDLRWYGSATGGSPSSIAPTPSTATPATNTWWVTQTVAGCESPRSAISVTVSSPSPEPTANPVAPYCQNTTANQLTANGTGLRWYPTATGGSGSSTAPIPSTTSAGTKPYYVTQTPSGSCESDRLEIDVTVNPTPQLSIDPVTGSPCPGGTVKLQANGADSYSWSPAAGLSDPSVGNPIATLQSDIQYTVTGTTDGCDATAQVDLTVGTNCSASGSGSGLGSGYSVPNAFTPNGDGANDLFRVKTGDSPKSFNMTIFNRYGGKIFETADVGAGWDGTIGGNQAPTGAYVYMIALTTSSGMRINKQGTVILIR